MRTKRHIKEKKTFAIVIDGETEYWYFQMLKRNEKSIAVDIEPKIPQKKKLSDQYQSVIELSKNYDKVYWIIDLDVIISESLSVKKGNKRSIDTFLEYKKIIAKKYKNITLIINQPCLEFWFLVHFEATTQQFSNCEEAGKKLKKYLPDYEKSKKYFTKNDHDIYIKLKPHLNTAFSNVDKLPLFDSENLNKGTSEMGKFFEEIQLKKRLSSPK